MKLLLSIIPYSKLRLLLQVIETLHLPLHYTNRTSTPNNTSLTSALAVGVAFLSRLLCLADDG